MLVDLENFDHMYLLMLFIIKLFKEEYVKEGIQWKEIKYFNNLTVCQLIEDRRPKPGVMAGTWMKLDLFFATYLIL